MEFAPNGRWYAYASDEGGNNSDVYLRPFPGSGAAIRVSDAGGSSPRWRKDGRELFYLDGARHLVAVQIEFVGRPSVLEAKTFTTAPITSNFDVHPDGQQILMWPQGSTQHSSQLTLLRDWVGMLEERK